MKFFVPVHSAPLYSMCCRPHLGRRTNWRLGDELPSVGESDHACCFCAMNAAEHLSVVFHSMADDPASAMIAYGRQHMDRTFETIKRVGSSGEGYLKTLVIVIPASITNRHSFKPPCKFVERWLPAHVPARSRRSTSNENYDAEMLLPWLKTGQDNHEDL